MFIRILFLVFVFTICPVMFLNAQNFRAQQRQQRAAIQSAYKKRRITQKEYYKLMNEQEAIAYAIAKAGADGYIDAREKNSINGKLQRADKRLFKYKTNREIY